MSHTILHGVVRQFIDFICNAGAHILVRNKPFYLPKDVRELMDSFIERIQLPSAFNRAGRKLEKYDYFSSNWSVLIANQDAQS